MRSKLPLFLMCALSLYAWASDEPTDALGCHDDTVTGNYHCHTGPLAGREFLSVQEAKEALREETAQRAQDKADELAMADAKTPFKMLSWNFTSIGSKRVEYDRLVALISEVDLLVVQELEFNAKGDNALSVIANLLGQKLNQRICKAWFKSSTGERGRHAFLWRDQAISFVEKNGVMLDHCSDAPLIIRVEEKTIPRNDPLMGTFYLKSRRQMFNVVSIQFDQRPAQAEKVITTLFKKAGSGAFPTLVAGNFKVSAQEKSFREATQMNFRAALIRKPNATSNLWTRGLTIVRAEAVDLHTRFPELSAKECDAKISSFPPLLAEISFSLQEALDLKTQLVKRAVKQKALRKEVEKIRTPPKPAPKPLPIHDDLEKEAE